MIRKILVLSLCVVFLPAAHAESFASSLLSRAKTALDFKTVDAPTTQLIEVGFSPEGSAEKLVLKVIDSTKSSIRLAAYSFTSPTVVRALLAAKKRGVDVVVVVDEKGNKSKASIQALNLLVNAKIPTRTLSAYAIHHDKFIISDSRHIKTGSFNYSVSANKRNSENVLVVWNNPPLAGQYLMHWESRYAQGRDYHSTY